MKKEKNFNDYMEWHTKCVKKYGTNMYHEKIMNIFGRFNVEFAHLISCHQ